ncbi:MAG: ABC transporter permease [Candidatus Diapherotrites archaeon]|nr:ABC transporter permease [Candidatus Diapherotrites archaeon]
MIDKHISYMRQALAFLERNLNDESKDFWSYLWLFVWPSVNLLMMGSVALFLGEFVDSSLFGMTYLEFLLTGTIVSMFAGSAFESITWALLKHVYNQTLPAIVMAPINRLSMFAGEVGYAFLKSLLMSSFIYGVAWIAFGFVFRGNLLGLLVILVFTLFSISGLAIAIASAGLIMRNTPPLMEVSMMLIMLVSGAYYPVESLPAWLQTIAWASPLTYSFNAVRSLAVGASFWDVSGVLPFLLVLGVVNLLIGVRIFNKLERLALMKGKLLRH